MTTNIPRLTAVIVGLLALATAITGCLMWAQYDHMVHQTGQGTNGPMGAVLVLFGGCLLIGVVGGAMIGRAAGSPGSGVGARVGGALGGLGVAAAILVGLGLVAGWAIPALRAEWYGGVSPAVGVFPFGFASLVAAAIGLGVRWLTDRPGRR